MSRSCLCFLLLFTLTVYGCDDPSDPVDDSGVDALDGTQNIDEVGEYDDDADRDGPLLVDTGEIFIDGCQQFGSTCEPSSHKNCGKCQYRIIYRADVCTKDKPCANAFAYWPAMASAASSLTAAMNDIINRHPDLVIFMLQPNYPGEVLPISLGHPERQVMLWAEVSRRLKSKDELGIWTGENLLMGGCSQGGTVYPVIAARYADDADWIGTNKTAVCMSDGVVNLGFQEDFIGQSTGETCLARHERIAVAYTVENPVLGHSCLDSPNSQCACDPAHVFPTYPGDCNDGDCVDFDSIVRQSGDTWEFSPGVSADSFAVQHWKLITEGESWNDTEEACTKDVVAAAPYQALCSLLDADDQHSCSYLSFPNIPHCGYYNSHLTELCVDWFLAL